MTEWISGVNIPSCQLMIGMGIRLERMADIRRLFGQDPEGCSAIGTSLAVTHVICTLSVHVPHAMHMIGMDHMTCRPTVNVHAHECSACMYSLMLVNAWEDTS